MSTLPIGARLHPTHIGGSTDVESDEYEHWTVGDLIEILTEYPADSRVWLIAPDSGPDDDALVVSPPELITNDSDGNLFIY